MKENDIKENIDNKLSELINREGIIHKYYHFKSVQNFIYHLNKLNDKDIVIKVCIILNEYLDSVKDAPITDRMISLELFEEFIRPVGNIYERNAGFMPMLRSWVVFFWIVFFFLILYVFSVPPVFFSLVATSVVIYYIYIIRKRIDHKVYGFMW